MPNRLASLVATIAAVALLAACGGDSPPARDTAGPSTTATNRPDADEADDRVEQALGTDSLLHRYGLDADADDDRIVLKGTVRTDVERVRADSVAARFARGATIDNRIEVDAKAAGSDQVVDVDELEDRIEDAFGADTTFRGHIIDVDEDNGRIVLAGRAPASVKAAAEALARRLAGAVQVINLITDR